MTFNLISKHAEQIIKIIKVQIYGHTIERYIVSMCSILIKENKQKMQVRIVIFKVTKSLLISLIFYRYIYTNQPFIKTFSKYCFNVTHRRLHRTICFNCWSVYILTDQAASYFTDNNSGRLGDYQNGLPKI